MFQLDLINTFYKKNPMEKDQKIFEKANLDMRVYIAMQFSPFCVHHCPALTLK